MYLSPAYIIVITRPTYSLLLPTSSPPCSLETGCYAFDKDIRRTARKQNETHRTHNNRLRLSRYRQISNCNRILIFRSCLPTLPRKISAYLRTKSPSGANTRIMRGLHNILNINYLHLRDISSHCKKHHFGLRNGPFQRLKSTISHPKMGLIALRNGQYWKVKCII